jgi:hypothetical protein
MRASWMPEEMIPAQYNPFHTKSLAGIQPGEILRRARIDSKIHWISANVQMERFYH